MPSYDHRRGEVTRRAAAALRAGQQTFTREQVAYLLALAYDAGRTAAYRDDLAELHSVWEDHASRRQTYEQRITERLEQMAEAGRRINTRLGRPESHVHPGGPVDWNTGRPARHLEAAA